MNSDSAEKIPVLASTPSTPSVRALTDQLPHVSFLDPTNSTEQSIKVTPLASKQSPHLSPGRLTGLAVESDSISDLSDKGTTMDIAKNIFQNDDSDCEANGLEDVPSTQDPINLGGEILRLDSNTSVSSSEISTHSISSSSKKHGSPDDLLIDSSSIELPPPGIVPSSPFKRSRVNFSNSSS